MNEEQFLALEEHDKDTTEEMFAALYLAFRQTIKDMEAEIDAWYREYAKGKNISYVEAKKLLTVSELLKFRAELDDWMEKPVGESWVSRLKNIKKLSRISRMDSLKYKLWQLINELFFAYKSKVDEHLASTYDYQYKHTAYEISKATHVGKKLTVSKKNLDKPWAVDGKSYSERIDAELTKVMGEVGAIIPRAVATNQDIAEEVSKRVTVSSNNAARLISTETTAARSDAQADAMKDSDVDQYKFVATLERRTTRICRSLDGKIFNLSDMQKGVNAPPMHPRCRSVTVPYHGMTYGTRVARDKDDKIIYVPASMTYEEWHKQFIV